MFSRLYQTLLFAQLLAVSNALYAAEPIEVAVSTVVDVPADTAWTLMSDLGVAHYYVPGLTGTQITTAQQTGEGASRRVYQGEGEFLEETVTHWVPGQGFVLRLHRGDEPMAPFKEAQFRYHMEALNEKNTRVTLAIVVLMPLGSLGEWLGDWLARPALESELTRVAAGLKHYYESGLAATDADRERLLEQVEPVPAPGA